MGPYVAALGCVLQGSFILAKYHQKRGWELGLKTAASLAFVCFGAWCVKEGGGLSWFSCLVLAGLVLGMAGDVVLAVRPLKKNAQTLLIAGALLFLLGHAAYIGALASRRVFSLVFGALVAVQAAPLEAWLMVRYLPGAGLLRAPIVFYLLAVTAMAGCAVGAWALTEQTAMLRFALGGAAFAVSDHMLVCGLFSGGDSRKRDAVLLSLYYAAQLWIASSCLPA